MLRFETKAVGSEKIFTVTFPIDGLLSIHWEPKELKKLRRLDSSNMASDQLKMLSMLAKKMEVQGEEQYNLIPEDKSEQE